MIHLFTHLCIWLEMDFECLSYMSDTDMSIRKCLLLFFNPRTLSVMKMTTNSVLVVMLQIFPSEVGCFGQWDISKSD